MKETEVGHEESPKGESELHCPECGYTHADEDWGEDGPSVQADWSPSRWMTELTCPKCHAYVRDA
jgi:hypothetical protein